MFIDGYTWNTTRILATEQVAKDTVALRLEKPASYQFHAGQYTVVRAANLVRQYSFSSAPDQPELELLVQREPDGAMSNWFHAATVGTELELSQAFGNFVAPQPPRPLVCIAGRVGIAPFISMLRDGVTMRLLYAVRDPDELCYHELLSAHHASLFISSSGQRLELSALKPYLLPDQFYYLCGSKRFVDAMMERLTHLGAPTSAIRRELFTLQ